MEMEEEELRAKEQEQKELELAALHPSLLEDKKYRDEFDSIHRELTHHHTYKGRHIDDNEDIKIKGQLKAINVRQSSDNLLVFRKLPLSIWFAGLCI